MNKLERYFRRDGIISAGFWERCINLEDKALQTEREQYCKVNVLKFKIRFTQKPKKILIRIIFLFITFALKMTNKLST